MGHLIVIEGADGSGKATQVKLLHDRLSKNKKVHVYDFPRYEDSRAGKLVGEMLKGKHGNMGDISPYLAAMPYALDRSGTARQMHVELNWGHVVLCNRYTTANLIHGGAKFDDPAARETFIQYIEDIEYDELEIPQPDIVICLAVPVTIAAKLIEQKVARSYLEGDAKDQLEKDLEHQEKAAAVARDLCATRGDWRLVKCACDEKLRTPEDIHEEVWKIVCEAIGE